MDITDVDRARIALLNEVPLFSGLSAEALLEVLPFVQRRSYFKNTVIISEGDPGESLFIVESGEVRDFLNEPGGKEVVLCTEKRGGILGEVALLDGEPRSASVMTLEKSVFLVITRDDFRTFISGNPDAAMSIFSALTLRIRRLTDNVKSLALRSLQARVAEKLEELAPSSDSGGVRLISERLTHQDLADRVGGSREAVGRVLRELSNDGFIEMERSQIRLLKTLPATS